MLLQSRRWTSGVTPDRPFSVDSSSTARLWLLCSECSPSYVAAPLPFSKRNPAKAGSVVGNALTSALLIGLCQASVLRLSSAGREDSLHRQFGIIEVPFMTVTLPESFITFLGV